MLSQNGVPVAREQWMLALFAELQQLAKLLDGKDDDQYQLALAKWHQAVIDPNETLSGQVMKTLADKGLDHGAWVMALAKEYQQQLLNYPLSAAALASFEAEAQASIESQLQMEAADRLNFDDFLVQYFADEQPRKQSVSEVFVVNLGRCPVAVGLRQCSRARARMWYGFRLSGAGSGAAVLSSGGHPSRWPTRDFQTQLSVATGRTQLYRL